MRFLHTSDWHVGKVLHSRNRLEEQTRVLAEIVRIARDRAVDAVLVAGDLYETSAPSAEAQKLVVHTLMALRATGAEVIVIAGNHDHAATFDAYRPLMAAAGIHVVGLPRAAADGGVITFTARSTGERVNVAALPFLSQRYVIRAAQILAGTPAEQASTYDRRIRDLLAHLRTGFTDDGVNIVMAHLTVTNGLMGGGERPAQSVFDYHVPASAFGAEPHYVALGHLHRNQSIPAPCPVHYSGSPITVDFGEEDNTAVVLAVDVTPTTPAAVVPIPLKQALALRTVRGTVAELVARADEFGDDLLRVFVCEPTRAGLREEVQEVLPNALQVRIESDYASPVNARRHDVTSGTDRSPGDLFADYCDANAVVDDDVRALFGSLHDLATSATDGREQS